MTYRTPSVNMEAGALCVGDVILAHPDPMRIEALRLVDLPAGTILAELVNIHTAEQEGARIWPASRRIRIVERPEQLGLPLPSPAPQIVHNMDCRCEKDLNTAAQRMRAERIRNAGHGYVAR